MLDMKTAETAPALFAAKERHAANIEAHKAAVVAFNVALCAADDHENAAAAADRVAIEMNDTLVDLVGKNADESVRVPVRAAHADEIARAAFHRKEAAAKRAQLPELEKRVNHGLCVTQVLSDLDNAEFNDALAAYIEHLPTLEPIVSRLNAAAKPRAGRSRMIHIRIRHCQKSKVDAFSVS